MDALRQAQQALQMRDQESVAPHRALQQQQVETEQLRRKLSSQQEPPGTAAGATPTSESRGSRSAPTGLHGDCGTAGAPMETVHSSRLSGRLSHGSSDRPLDSVSPISAASSRPVEVDLTTAESAGCHDALAKEILAASEGYRAQTRALGDALSAAFDAAGGPHDGFLRPSTANQGPLRGTRADLDAFLANRRSVQHAKSAERNVHDICSDIRDFVKRPVAAEPALQTGWTPDDLQLWPEAEGDEEYEEYDDEESEDDRDPAMIPTPTSIRSTTSRATFCGPNDIHDVDVPTTPRAPGASSSAPAVEEDRARSSRARLTEGTWMEPLVTPTPTAGEDRPQTGVHGSI